MFLVGWMQYDGSMLEFVLTFISIAEELLKDLLTLDLCLAKYKSWASCTLVAPSALVEKFCDPVLSTLSVSCFQNKWQCIVQLQSIMTENIAVLLSDITGGLLSWIYCTDVCTDIFGVLPLWRTAYRHCSAACNKSTLQQVCWRGWDLIFYIWHLEHCTHLCSVPKGWRAVYCI